MSLRRATGEAEKDIVCRYCAHPKVWHFGAGRCRVDDEGYECDCEAWDYGVNVADDPNLYMMEKE